MIKTSAKVFNQLKIACGFVLSFLSTLFVFSSVSFATPNIAASSGSATCKNSTLETYSGTSNLSANWNANTINLHWYADSDATTELTGSGIPTSCVYDGALTPPPVASIPQKTGYTFAGWKVRGLPDGYTKLQYIQSSGTQYINTGVKPTSSSFVKLVVMFGDSPNYRFFGSTSTSLAMGFGDGARLYVNNMNSGSHVLSNITSILNRKTTIIYKGTTVNINGTDYTCAQANAGNTDIYINARGDSLSTRVGKGRWYLVQIGSGSTLQRDFIPVRRDSDNAVGMWDMVTKTFFENAGTGSFTAGPVAQ